DVQHVYVRSGGETGSDWSKQELHKLDSQLGYDLYGGLVDVPSDLAGKPVEYGFELVDGSADVYWSHGKVFDALSQMRPAAQSVRMQPSFVTPAWAEHAVWYQIFPERFRNGDPSNDPTNDADDQLIRWTSRWFSTQPGEAPGMANFYEGKGNVWKRRYGGDIQGIDQALPYLRKLGINAIYLNPIFEAESMHKYDTTDYRHVDNHFGVKGDWPVAGETEDPATWKWSASDKVFLNFLADAHQQGFKVVIDGVFNHVGRADPFFQDVLEHGKNSKYADWFEITDWGNPANWHKMQDPYAVHGKPGGIQWKAWDGPNGHLPAWKKDPNTGLAPGPYQHIMAITKRWLAPDGDPTRGVDGFRLDAANEIPHPFWVAWRQLVKSTKPDAYISGEIWSPAQAWINDGKQFDAVMNYQFAMPTLEFFANRSHAMTPDAYARRMAELVYMYPQQASRVMMNLFDSHDTDRLASMFVNPDRAYDAGNRMQDPEGKHYDPRKPTPLERQRMLQAVGMQMTFLGALMFYYGDEAGMWSPDDPSDRQPMTWPGMKFDDPQVGFNPAVFQRYQALIAIRAALPALQSGDFYPVLTDDAHGTFVFARQSPTQRVYVVFNRNEKSQKITFSAGDDDGKQTFINYADRDSVQVDDPAADSSARARLVVKSDARPIVADQGSLTVNVGAYDLAILADKP
ncbi:MAG: glycoside hydrolase family 13 protein, partial [Tepidisphaeraceae bacterium]